MNSNNHNQPVGKGQWAAKHPDIRLVFTDGRIALIKNDMAEPLCAGMKLDNGTEIMLDGTVIPLGGKKFRLQEGDSISARGEIILTKTSRRSES